MMTALNELQVNFTKTSNPPQTEIAPQKEPKPLNKEPPKPTKPTPRETNPFGDEPLCGSSGSQTQFTETGPKPRTHFGLGDMARSDGAPTPTDKKGPVETNSKLSNKFRPSKNKKPEKENKDKDTKEKDYKVFEDHHDENYKASFGRAQESLEKYMDETTTNETILKKYIHYMGGTDETTTKITIRAVSEEPSNSTSEEYFTRTEVDGSLILSTEEFEEYLHSLIVAKTQSVNPLNVNGAARPQITPQPSQQPLLSPLTTIHQPSQSPPNHPVMTPPIPNQQDIFDQYLDKIDAAPKNQEETFFLHLTQLLKSDLDHPTTQTNNPTTVFERTLRKLRGKKAGQQG